MSDTPPVSYPGKFDIDDDYLAGDPGELPLYADLLELLPWRG
jgi:hypothetical protein